MVWALVAALVCAAWAPGCASSPRRAKGTRLADLIARDGLEAPGDASRGWVGQRVLMDWKWFVPVGGGPRSIVMRFDELTATDKIVRSYHLYSIQDWDNPVAMGVARGQDEGRGEVWWEVVDLEGDGAHEAVVVGSPLGGGPAPLRILSYWDGAWRDRVWGEDMGDEYVVVDHDRDGAREVVALRRGPERVELTMLGEAGGFWRVLETKRPTRDWLPHAFATLVESGVARRDQLDLLARALRERGLEPARRPGVVQALIRAHEGTKDDTARARALRAMAWPGDEEARAYARAWDPEGAGEQELAAARGLLAVVGDSQDRAGLVDLMRATWEGDPKQIDAPWVAATLVGFDTVQDVRAADALVALWTREGLDSGRREVLGGLVRGCAECAEATARRTREDLASQARVSLWQTVYTKIEEGDPSWRRAFDVEDLQASLTARSTTEREHAAATLGAYGDAAARAALDAAARNDPEGSVRHAAARALARLAHRPDGEVYFAALAGAQGPFERAAWHELLAHADEPWSARALSGAQRGGHIRPYADALAQAAPRRGREWALAAGAMAELARSSEDHGARLQATRALGSLDTLESRETLRARVSVEPDATVRAHAIAALSRLEPVRERDRWLEAWERESDLEVLAEVALALVATRDPDAFAAVEARLGTDEGARDALIVRALGSRLDDEAARALVARALAQEECGPSVDAVAGLVSARHELAPELVETARSRDGCDEDARLRAWLDAAAASPSGPMIQVARGLRDAPARRVRVAAQRALEAWEDREQ